MPSIRKTTLSSIILAGLSLLGLGILGLGVPTQAASITTCPLELDVDTNPETTVECIVATPGTIAKVAVELILENVDDPEDNYIDNLFITLIYNGISVVLYDGDDDNSDAVMNALFDDAAADAPPVSGSVIGTFQPSGPGSLADFNGDPAAGSWTLSILDDNVPEDGTDLVKFNLIITTVAISEPATLALLGLGLAGLGIARRRKAA